MKIYQRIAGLIIARQNCIDKHNENWRATHEENINKIIEDHIPHGSGIDNGTYVDYDKSNEKQIVFNSAYHAMNENGCYDRWIDFTVKIKASLQFGFDLSITGNFGKYQYMKDYLHDLFSEALDTNSLRI